MKKMYFSIAEVSGITGLSQNQLRYLEKFLPRFKVHKIRNRRYYSQKNITYLVSTLRKNALPQTRKTDDGTQILKQIDAVLAKFKSLSESLN